MRRCLMTTEPMTLFRPSTHTHTHTDEGRDIGKGCDGNTDAMQVRDVI